MVQEVNFINFSFDIINFDLLATAQSFFSRQDMLKHMTHFLPNSASQNIIS